MKRLLYPIELQPRIRMEPPGLEPGTDRVVTM